MTLQQTVEEFLWRPGFLDPLAPEGDTRLNFPRALQLAREIIDDFGADYIYQKPLYEGILLCCNWDRANNKPSCLIGHVLHRFGVSRERLIHNNITSINAFSDELTPLALNFLERVQELQDSGVTWGDAVETSLVELTEPT